MNNAAYLKKITASDNAALAQIIRSTLEEFGAAKAGTVYFDKTTDCVSDVFKKEGSNYFVAYLKNSLAGGCGFYPTTGLPAHTCELVKLYLTAEARGKGIGKLLMHTCEEEARTQGYKYIYLETMPELNIAVPLYEKMGYHYLPAPLGNSGHCGCSIWMMKEL